MIRSIRKKRRKRRTVRKREFRIKKFFTIEKSEIRRRLIERNHIVIEGEMRENAT